MGTCRVGVPLEARCSASKEPEEPPEDFTDRPAGTRVAIVLVLFSNRSF